MAEQNDVYQNVYVYDCGNSRGNRLALADSGDVFGAGWNSLVGDDLIKDYPMIERGGDVISRWTKVDNLCGLGIRKIDVGSNFGIALTVSNELLILGLDSLPIDEQDVVVMQTYRKDARCGSCNGWSAHNYSKKKVGKAALNYCAVNKQFPICRPQDVFPVRKFVKKKCGVSLRCFLCGGTCSSKLVNSVQLNYCHMGDFLLDFKDYRAIVGSQQPGKFFKRVKLEYKILDYSAHGIILLMAGNNIAFTGSKPRWVETKISCPARMTAIYTLQTGILLTSDEGGLYWWGRHGQQFLQKVPLPAAVTKVCCTRFAAICMLSDNSVYILYDESHTPQRLVSKNGSDTFHDIAAASGHHSIHVQADESSTLKVPYPNLTLNITFKFGKSDPRNRFLEDVCSQIPSVSPTLPPLVKFTKTEASTSSESAQTIPNVASQQPSILTPSASPLPTFLAGLYGQKTLSDVIMSTVR